MNAPTAKSPRVPTPSPQQLAKANKERKQLVVLGGLALAFVVVLIVQFGGGSNVGESTPDDEPMASAAMPVTSAPAPDPAGGAARRNAALSDPDGGELVEHTPFKPFWDFGGEAEEQQAEEEPALPPPAVTLSGAMPGGRNPQAFIDGKRFGLGDKVQGWTLVAIGSREVTLRAPDKRKVVISMPKVPGVN